MTRSPLQDEHTEVLDLDDEPDLVRTLAGAPPVRRGLIKRHLYLVPNSIVVSRGCPHVCDFCYKDAFFEGSRSFRGSPRRSSMACAAWGGCGRPPAPSTPSSRPSLRRQRATVLTGGVRSVGVSVNERDASSISLWQPRAKPSKTRSVGLLARLPDLLKRRLPSADER